MTNWKFRESPDVAVFTLDDVLKRRSPLRQVSHDIEGDWQFTDGQPIADRKQMLVHLKHMAELEPAILDLADLPLGWRALRAGPGAPWTREATYPLGWDELVAEANEYAKESQDRLMAEFQLGAWESWHCDQETARLTFSSNGVVRVQADVRFVGSLSFTSKTWLWSWANSSVLEQVRPGIDWLHAFGEENAFERLVQPKWDAEEVDAWEVTAIACYLLQAEGVYRAPDKSGHTFLLLDEVRWAA